MVLLGVLVCLLYYVPAKNGERTISGIKPPSRLNDPGLAYAYQFSSGFCNNGEGEQGGCYAYMYLYDSGKFVKESGFVRSDDTVDVHPTIERDFSGPIAEGIIDKIRRTGVLGKNCPETPIEDADYFYQVNIDGVKKSFSNPPPDCKYDLDSVLDLINATVNYRE